LGLGQEDGLGRRGGGGGGGLAGEKVVQGERLERERGGMML